ncbi:MAG: DUF2723 domain-containing protein [Sediminibacterium sp.]|nr:DUF2723 domain-containing protein [Sediminibacterium sp.]
MLKKLTNENYIKVNNIIGWVIGLFTTIIYISCVEPKGSFFDCGEFLSCGYKLQVTHPPGYPMYVLLARIFAILCGSDPQLAAKYINSMSAVASGMTIMFLFWSITILARKIVAKKNQIDKLSSDQIFLIFISGIVGALCFAFSETFWFNAEEAEVYALSSFFTALIFWGLLRWENGPATRANDRWLVFIFYITGLAIGVHLLNLLTIPAIVLVYYYKNYAYSFKGFVYALIIGAVVLVFVQIIFIQYSIWWAGYTDVFFVNNLGLPFFSGFIFFYIVVFGFLFYLFKVSLRKKIVILQISVWAMAFMLLGYGTYFTSMIRAAAPIPINMFKVSNPMALVSYLSRDQYDDAPLLIGPDYIETPSRKPKRDIILKRDTRYVNAGKLFVQDWSNTQTAHLFPRMFNSANDNQQSQMYADFTDTKLNDPPTFLDNIKFFINYQCGWMFARYLMHNFVGRENDLVGYGNVRDGNYLSGIEFIDNWRLGPTDKLPDTIGAKSKSNNHLFYLPFVLGLLGFIFVYKQARKNFWVLLLLFIYTGIAIVVFTNQSGQEARETDYVFVGAFYIFAIWIGLGVLYFNQLLGIKIKNVKNLNLITLATLMVPLIMFFQEYDDHDRSNKTLAFDMARNYLESCPPNAVLFVFTDNDLYPLFYAQEVEGVRTDVRIVSNNLSKAAWHVTRLLEQENRSAPFDILFKPEQIEGGRRNVLFYHKIPGYENDSIYYPLEKVFREVLANDNFYFDIPTNSYPLFTEEKKANVFPCYRFSVKVDKEKILSNHWLEAGDSLLDEITFEFNRQRNYIIKNELVVYSLLATTHWERPICFTSKYSLNDLGLLDYMVQRGMVFQLLPVKNKLFNESQTEQLITQKFGYGNPTKTNVYFDNENRAQFNFIKVMISEFCNYLIDQNKNAEANKVLSYFDSQINTKATPYGVTNFNKGNQYNYYSFLLLTAAYRLKNKVLFEKIAQQLQKDMLQQYQYYAALGNLEKSELLAQSELAIRNQDNDLSEFQKPLALDILGSNKMVEDIDNMRRELNK